MTTSHRLVLYSMLFWGSAALRSCAPPSPGQDSKEQLDSSVSRGKILAARYCQSCHQLPDPSLLDKRTWIRGVLPGMGPRLGIFSFNDHVYPSSIRDTNIGRNSYPSLPLLGNDQWQDLLNYYWASAPDSLSPINRKERIRSAEGLFAIQMPGKTAPGASACLVRIDTTAGRHRIWLAEALPPKIYRYDRKLKIMDSFTTNGPVVDLLAGATEDVLCNIGLLNPNDTRKGSVSTMSARAKFNTEKDMRLMFDSLARPVQVIAADLNGDKLRDYLVCEFGNLRGALSWMENTGQGNFARHVLRASPGAIKAFITDYNHDGLPDIWALFAQGDEGIILFTNQGKGRFTPERILSFPAVYGSTSFELDDFNKDGFPDILYTCGDNADYSPILKPYHGIYIYLNDGSNHFRQRYFFPMHGCFKAMAADFDGDGDLDIAAISFFPDHSHPAEAFFYLENKADWQFQPYNLPITAGGRWLTMDIGDFYGSGRPDIVLGNFNFGAGPGGPAKQNKSLPPFVILKNKMK